MTDRFDLEQDIMKCWSITDDLLLYLERHDSMTEDQKLNFLIGLNEIYGAKFEKLFATYEELTRMRKIL